MWQQRVHTLISLKKRRDEPVDERAIDVPANRSWYPFQLAFLLKSAGDHQARPPGPLGVAEAVADLLWFPTGGGKTEAYLGLSAYTMALRRLQGPVAGRSGEHGVAVLMRYTLRLLTIQQFQRAAALICACEVIRRGDEKKLGQGAVPHRALGRPDRRRRTRPTRPPKRSSRSTAATVQGTGQRLARPVDQLPVVRVEDRPRPGHQGRDASQGPRPHHHPTAATSWADVRSAQEHSPARACRCSWWTRRSTGSCRPC